MKEEKKTKDVVPSAYNIISSNRSIGYSLSAAIADIIDNSISAEASRIDIYSPPDASPSLLIIDDGIGMNEDELSEAMTFGGKKNCLLARDLNDLGRFGMGLKTASLSQCKCLEVISKKKGCIVGGCWDLDYLESHDSWKYIVLSKDECIERISETFLAVDTYNHGTCVRWTKFDKLKKTSEDQNIEFDILLENAIGKLELIFHRYLEGEEGIKKIEISYNKNKLSPNNPFLPSKTPSISNPIVTMFNNNEVTITPYKLPHPDKLNPIEQKRLSLGSSLLESQGFYLYRNKRLIDYATWFYLAPKLEKTKLSRIQIDINNAQDSEWSLDIKKSHVVPPQKIRSELKNILINNQIKSEKTFKPRQKKKTEICTYWNINKIQGSSFTREYLINLEHPLISSFMEELPDDRLRKMFRIILENISKFFPFRELEYDNQNDEKIENTSRKIDDKTKMNILFYLKLGYTIDAICSFYPDMEDAIQDFLRENQR